MLDREEKIALCYFDMITEAIKQCFVPIPKKFTPYEVRQIKLERHEFAKSKLLKMWCDCSNNFTFEKLSKIIIEKNL